jgi:hypothetical protein
MVPARLKIFCALLLSTTWVSSAEFQFVVIGDTRPRFQSESFRPFENLITKINEIKPAFVINLGDLIYGYGFPGKETQWNKYESVIKNIEAPYFQLPGNHDTHSKAARRIYGRRFGKFFQSFDHEDCHFVLLDNTEHQRWGYLGPAQLEWLRKDLMETHARSVFVFMHFPVWEPERVTPQYHEFWRNTLHPLFKETRVRAVFAGHYHTYGPTREFDGIRYFITGGGGAEMIPEYKKSGGQYHFMKIKVTGDEFDPRVITERGELTDPEADVMGGLLFAARHVSRIGVKRDGNDLRTGVVFDVSVANPAAEAMTGEATWLFDESAFSVTPRTATIAIPGGSSRSYSFGLKSLKESISLESLPQLQFRVSAGDRVLRFHREIRFLQQLPAPYHPEGRTLDGRLQDWATAAWVDLGKGPRWEAKMAGASDGQKLYLAFRVPAVDTAETEELGFVDELQIGFAPAEKGTDFGNSFLRFGFKPDSRDAWDRTAGHAAERPVPGIEMATRKNGSQKDVEVAIPLRLLAHGKSISGNRLILDVSYPIPEEEPPSAEPANPRANTLSYRIRYGSDSLVPVSFLELNLENKPTRRR